MSQVPYERTKWTAFWRRADFNMNVLEHLPMPLELPTGAIICAALGRRKLAARTSGSHWGWGHSKDCSPYRPLCKSRASYTKEAGPTLILDTARRWIHPSR